jgi:dolichol-phosphate mannosyltransferase
VPGPPELSIIVPTFNEADALRGFVPRLVSAIRPWSAEVIVVDDSSPDGTAAVARELLDSTPARVIVRPRRMGLASAVLDGVAATTGTVVLVLDGDGSHPPEATDRMVGPLLRHEAEFVLGSRHVAGGSAPGLRSTRRLVSAGASLLARPLVKVRDPMSGFFSVRRDVLARAPLRPLGFKIALEIMVKCRPHPIYEIPIHFGERIAGRSKLSAGEYGGYLRHLARLYAWRWSETGAARSTR